MRIRIVVSYVPRYRTGHAFHFVPPITGIHLAALTPAGHEVEVVHEQVREVPVEPLPDLLALSFFSPAPCLCSSIARPQPSLPTPSQADLAFWGSPA